MNPNPVPRPDLRPAPTLRLDPRLILGSHLLALGCLELKEAIRSELEQNPALERLEDDEPVREEEVLARLAPQELAPSSADREFWRSLPLDEDRPDWVDLASTFDDLADHLLAQVRLALPESEWPIAEYLVGSLDERGYLTVSVEQAALDAGVDLGRVKAALDALQACEPAGIAASSLRECLLLQIRRRKGVLARLAESILSDSFDELVSRDVRALSRRHRATPAVVERALQLIASLRPFPAEGYELGPARPAIPAVAVPEIVFRRDETGWLIEVPDGGASSLTVSRSFRQASRLLRHAGREHADERRYVTEAVGRAERFIEALRRRQETLFRIGAYFVEHQSAFLLTGDYAMLRPMSRARLAADLGLHESTVSRATADKHLQIATGEVVPFEVFFTPSLRVRKLIEEILATEDPRFPLSDERIAELLRERGVQISRRTVAKYRDGSKMPSSRRRRSA